MSFWAVAAKNGFLMLVLFLCPVVILTNITVIAVAPITFLATALYFFTIVIVMFEGNSRIAAADVTLERDASVVKTARVKRVYAVRSVMFAYVVCTTILVIWSWAFILRYTFGGESVNLGFVGASLGGVTKDSIVVWARDPGSEDGFYVELATKEAAGTRTSNVLRLNATTDYTGAVLLRGLSPGKEYTFRALRAGAGTLIGSGSFRTLSGNDVSFAYSSCTMQRKTFAKSLDGVSTLASHASEIDFFAMLGDTIYADVPFLYKGLGDDVAKYRSMYRETLGSKEFLDLRSKVPGFFMMDDHEILNNIDLSITDRETFVGTDTDTSEELTATFDAAIGVWDDYLGVCNTGTNPRTGKPYYAVDAGAASFFFFDTRTSRVAANGSVPESFIGEDQNAAVREWLLNASPNQFKFLVSPQPWTRNTEERGKEGWAAHLAERDSILDFIESNGIKGCICLSADLHQVGVYEIRKGILDISVSPLDATGQAADYAPLNIDRELYEEWHYNEAFAIVNVNRTRAEVHIYQGGSTVWAGICLVAMPTLVVFLLAAVFVKKQTESIGGKAFIALLAVFLAAFLIFFSCLPSPERGAGKPRFSIGVDIDGNVNVLS